MQSRKLLGQGSPGRNPPRAVEGSTDHLGVHQGTLAIISMLQVQGNSTRLYTSRGATHKSWCGPWRMPWNMKAGHCLWPTPLSPKRSVETSTSRLVLRGGSLEKNFYVFQSLSSWVNFKRSYLLAQNELGFLIWML